MQFRVAKTSGDAHVAREFGYHSGPLTPEIVHNAARTAKILELQKQLRTAYNRHDARIRANKVELERLTLEAIEGGLTTRHRLINTSGRRLLLVRNTTSILLI
jgi:phage baseplate assembly protein W